MATSRYPENSTAIFVPAPRINLARTSSVTPIAMTKMAPEAKLPPMTTSQFIKDAVFPSQEKQRHLDIRRLFSTTLSGREKSLRMVRYFVTSLS